MAMKVFSSAINFKAVTLSDTTSVTCKAIYVGGAGNLYIAPSVGGTAVAFIGLAAGTILPVELKNGTINSTSSTATNIVALNW